MGETEDAKSKRELLSPLSDLNALALEKFKQLVDENRDMDRQWKQALLSLLEKGVPQDLDVLEKMAKAENNVKA